MTNQNEVTIENAEDIIAELQAAMSEALTASWAASSTGGERSDIDLGAIKAHQSATPSDAVRNAGQDAILAWAKEWIATARALLGQKEEADNSIDAMGSNLAEGIKKNAIAKAESAGVECAEMAWAESNSDQKAASARATIGNFVQAHDGLPMVGDFEYLEESLNLPSWKSLEEAEEEIEEAFSAAYLARLEELAAAHYEAEVKAEDAAMQAAALEGDANAVDYCYRAQI